MSAAVIAICLALDGLTGSAYELRVAALFAHDPAPAYIGLTAGEVRKQLGEPTSRHLGVWTYWHLSEGTNTFVRVTILRFRDDRVIAAVRGLKMVGCIIAVPRR